MSIDMKSVMTGIPLLDRQHEQYCRAVLSLTHLARAQDPSRDEVRRLIEQVRNYAVDNFDTEEQMMTFEQYPHEEEHVAKHDQFKDLVDTFLSELESQQDLHAFLKRAVQACGDWFVNQVQNDDMKLVKFIQDRRK